MIYAYGYSLLMLVAVFVVGYMVARAPIVRRFYLPTALVAGLILLIFSPQVLGGFGRSFHLSNGFYEIWKTAPKVLINFVFGCLFLAHPMMSLKKIWKSAGPQVAFGQMLAWGQYFWAGLLTLLVLMPIFGMPAITASLLEISFEGGHGTVAGMSEVFAKFNFENGRDIANGLATASLVGSLLLGVILINWAKRRGHFKVKNSAKPARNQVYYHKILDELRQDGLRARDQITLPRLFGHAGLILASVGAGIGLHGVISVIESLTWGKSGVHIMSHLPYFTFCMIGGMLVGEAARRLGFKIRKEIIQLFSAVFLSGLIMTAIGTMNLSFLNDKFEVFGLLFVAGTVWLLFGILILARRMFAKYWFENGIISFGQSMGMTATGLLFAQMVDPKNKTGAVESFGYKQLLFEPLMGGGLVTALSIPLISWMGLPIFTAICGAIMFVWLIIGLVYFGRRK